MQQEQNEHNRNEPNRTQQQRDEQDRNEQQRNESNRTQQQRNERQRDAQDRNDQEGEQDTLLLDDAAGESSPIALLFAADVRGLRRHHRLNHRAAAAARPG